MKEAWINDRGICWGFPQHYQFFNPDLALESVASWRDGGLHSDDAEPIRTYIAEMERTALQALREQGDAWWEGEGFKAFATEVKATTARMWATRDMRA